jgi:hypothetical protein
MKQLENIYGFGQEDPTDNRKLGDWESKYHDPKAKKEIRLEATYLAGLLVITPLIMLGLWLESPKYWLNLSDQKYGAILKYGLAWAAGVFGGTLFDLKWMYHSVARQLWHQDRRLWRIFTPHISGGLAFAVTALISSGIVKIFDSKSMDSHPGIVGLGFLVGYFSDSAIAKLYEVAETLFGTSRSKERHRNDGVVTSAPEQNRPS